MGNSKTLLISIALTGFAILLVMTYVDKMESEFTDGLGTMVSVVVSKQNILEETPLTAEKFTTKQFPLKYVQKNYLTNVKDVENTVAAIPMVKGEIITTNKLLFLGVRTGLAPAISKGKRAIKISATGIGAGLVKPGDRVDILAALRVQDGNKQSVKVKTALQDILVLATGNYLHREVRKFVPKKAPGAMYKCVQKKDELSDQVGNSIIVELTPKEAQIVVALKSKAVLYYSLRNPGDRHFEIMTPTTEKEIMTDTTE